MEDLKLNAEQNQPRLRVSVTARLIAALAYLIPAFGGALSSMLLINMFRELRNAESVGIVTVMEAMKVSALPAKFSLYLAAICGIVVIVMLVVRMVMQTKTASPPTWFFAVGGLFWLIPAGLFWKAQLMIIDVLSPGSSIGADGIGSVGEYIAWLLTLSVIATAVIFLILVVAAVLPFSLRSRPKWGPLIAATAIVILLIATAIAIPFLITEPKRKNETVNLPVNVKYADQDSDIEKETSIVLTLSSDNKLSLRQKNDAPDKVEKTESVVTREELPEKLKKLSRDMTPDKRIIYLKADINASTENVLQIFDAIRKIEINKVGLIVVGEKSESDPYQIQSKRFEVKLPGPTDNAEKAMVKPNPFILVAMLETDGKLKLNVEDMGMISDTKKLENKLVEVFKYREANGILREGTNEVEKTVILKISKSAKYGDFIKLVEAVKFAGAQPISIQLDDLNL